MSKIQRSNKEVKKPKKSAPLGKPITAGGATPIVPIVVPDRGKKK